MTLKEELETEAKNILLLTASTSLVYYEVSHQIWSHSLGKGCSEKNDTHENLNIIFNILAEK